MIMMNKQEVRDRHIIRMEVCGKESHGKQGKRMLIEKTLKQMVKAVPQREVIAFMISSQKIISVHKMSQMILITMIAAVTMVIIKSLAEKLGMVLEKVEVKLL